LICQHKIRAALNTIQGLDFPAGGDIVEARQGRRSGNRQEKMSDPFDSPFEEPATVWKLPDGETPHEDTIRALRAIGGAGEVTAKELVALAYYLNDHRDARHSWPGESLIRILAEMFDGHMPNKADRDKVHADIDAIEQECSRVQGNGEDGEAALPITAIRIEDFTLPEINRKVTIDCSDSGAKFEADLHHRHCSCPAWPNHRSKLKLDDVRRCCVHMVEAYHQLIKEDEIPGAQPIFKDLIADRAHRGRSMDIHAKWKLLKIKMRPHVVIYGSKDWSYAYAPDGNGFTRFGFHNGEKRWSFGQRPQSAKTIERFLEEAISGRIA
jgi:hypothetical protein